jgi:DNA-binding NarL/FixJ family response regulator
VAGDIKERKLDDCITGARVLVVDDHEVFRHGLRDLLAGRCQVVAEAREGYEAVQQAERHRPDVVLMDVLLPGMSGIAALREIKERLPRTQVVVVTAHDTDDTLASAIEAGATAFVSKHDTAVTIVQAVEFAAQGLAFLPPAVAKRVIGATARLMRGEDPHSTTTSLTQRESQVLQLMAGGKSTPQIARELFLSPRTVGNHIATLYRKLGIRDRASAVRYAIKEGIVHI